VPKVADRNKGTRHVWLLVFAGCLLLTTTFVDTIQYLIFHNTREMWVWIINSIAFLPIDVLLTALLVDRILHSRERDEQRQKLNMVIGAFFSEAGNQLLTRLTPAALNQEDIRHGLNVRPNWREKEFEAATRFALGLSTQIDLSQVDLESLRASLHGKREFLLRLLENPMLLEHESFTDLLWAIFHLSDELELREDLSALPPADLRHLAGDIHRAYTRLVAVWITYVAHLNENYPYLFSVLVRTHPFQDRPSPLVTD